MSHPSEGDPAAPRPGEPPSAGGPGPAPRPGPTLEKHPGRPDSAPPDGDDDSGRLRQSASAARYEPDGDDDHPAPRFWSVRRVPAGLTALALLGAVGALLYDVASVRADGPSAAWRRTLAEQLAVRQLDDPWVVSTAVAVLLLGIWLLVLALTPGLRGLLPMRRRSRQVRAGIERRAVAVVLQDRAMEVSGVRSVRVSVGRNRIRVVAQAHFRALDEIRGDLDAVLEHAIDELGLARQPALSVSVRRPAS